MANRAILNDLERPQTHIQGQAILSFNAEYLRNG